MMSPGRTSSRSVLRAGGGDALVGDAGNACASAVALVDFVPLLSLTRLSVSCRAVLNQDQLVVQFEAVAVRDEVVEAELGGRTGRAGSAMPGIPTAVGVLLNAEYIVRDTDALQVTDDLAVVVLVSI